jgi:penicillin-binding protein 1A
VYTTKDGRLQTAANSALRVGLIEYDRRHGYRGPLGHSDAVSATSTEEQLEQSLEEYSPVGVLLPAVVTAIEGRAARVVVKGRGPARIDWDGLSWARREQRGSLGPAPAAAEDVLTTGDVVYVVLVSKGNAQLAQLPEAQSALVALDPYDGAIASLVGGFDYFRNKYNRVTQARRLPGSGFKPFLYSAALENGFTPASVLLDAPIVLEGEGMEAAWRPENSSREFHGPTRLREALVRSRNLVSIRILRAMGTSTSIDYITRFGFTREQMPENLTLALGTMQATPLDIAAGYAVFANGGYRVEPYFIDRIENAAGQVVWHAEPRSVCDTCPPSPQVAERVISPQNAWLMTDMMADVIRRGTGQRAMALGRQDLAGKTGTTNDAKDAWFNGFSPNLVATVWVGFDQERSLGESEEGGKTALPIWVQFMREALKGVPQKVRERPEGLVTLRISPDTGRLASDNEPDAVSETFIADRLPVGAAPGEQDQSRDNAEEPAGSEPIF